jgi:class 3 adenylate cyclase/tetratricopeptide (TPR) repeat protein
LTVERQLDDLAGLVLPLASGMTDLPTGTVTFVFTDIEGSTQLLKRLGKRYGEALADHRKILRAAVLEHGGEEVDRQGDSFLFAFPRADDAAAAAVDGQRALAAHEWPAGSHLCVRMGMHTAEPTVSEEGYYGLGVHRAARIMAAAHGGQVLLSLATSSVLEDAELRGARLRDLGEHWLKDLDRPEHIYQLDVAGLKSAFPLPRGVERPGPRPAPGAQPAPADVADELLERSEALSALADSLAAVGQAARGQLVLVSGEAGVGKTALLRRFCDEQGRSARILWGCCDPLFTPRPLGPLLDIAETAGGELADVVQEGGRPQAVATALMHELGSRPTTVLVLDDVQWADEATLDVVALLGRRIDAVPALALLSYRDDELDRRHPLRILLGALATTRAVGRLEIAPLSRDAVAKLAEPHGANADELFGRTAGNPFFATEALAAGEKELPHTVRDAVLARAAGLSPPAAALLEAVAVAPPHVELWLLEGLADDAVDRLDECLTSGMLTHTPSGVGFRHELARLAVDEALPPNRRLSLHQKALAALAEPPTGAPDVERLAHHADAAGDGPAVLRFAPAAGARAAALGAHREAAAQYARALRFADRLAPRERAELLERRSHECYLTDQPDEALEALESAIECHRELGDTRKEGDSLRRLANILWCPGRTREASEAAQEALTVLEQTPPSRELAMAYATMGQLRLNLYDSDGAVAWGTRAFELAQRLDDTETVIYALTTIGSTELLAGIPEGREKLERSMELGESGDFPEHVGRAFLNLVWAGTRLRTYHLADQYLDRALAYFDEHGLDLWRFYLLAYRARIELDRGRWSEAVDSATLVFQKRVISTFPRILAFVVLGLVRARRGDQDAHTALDDALELAEPTRELPRIAPVAAARAEAAWLAGDREGVDRATEGAFQLALGRGAAWPIGELAYWRWRARLDSDVPHGAAEPYAVQMSGDWAHAAALWTEIGCPYEAALALADADDEDTLRRALDQLQALGARPAAAIVSRRLRERGVRGCRLAHAPRRGRPRPT